MTTNINTTNNKSVVKRSTIETISNNIILLMTCVVMLFTFSSCSEEEELYIQPEEVCTCNLILSVDSIDTEVKDHTFYNWDIVDNNTNTTAQDGYINYAFPNDNWFFLWGYRIYVTVQNIESGEVDHIYLVQRQKTQHTQPYYMWELDHLKGMRVDGTLTLDHLNEYPKALKHENYTDCNANRLHDERIIQYQLDNQ